jgi:hypothetical protein
MKHTIQELMDKSISFTDGKAHFSIGGQVWRAKDSDGNPKAVAFITLSELGGEEYTPGDTVGAEDIGPLAMVLMYDDPKRLAAHIRIAENVKEMLERGIAKIDHEGATTDRKEKDDE